MKVLLPLGTVVALSGVEHRVMIVGYARYKDGDKSHIYDYVGCYHPEGFVGSDKTMIFDHSMIESLFYIGYNNDDANQFMKKVTDIMSEASNGVPKEAVIGTDI